MSKRKDTSDPLIFQQSPVVEFATNTFSNVPVILQYETEPTWEDPWRQSTARRRWRRPRRSAR